MENPIKEEYNIGQFMKMNYIQISNILSFEDKGNINSAQKISFDKNLNILIGPNGVGKSNFLEIINQLFKNILYRPANYNEDNIRNHRVNAQVPLNQTITEANKIYSNLTSNNKSNNNIKKIKVSLKLNQNDKENLKFIYDNVSDFNAIFNKYSNVGVLFGINNSFPKINIDSTNNIDFEFEDINPPNMPMFNRVNQTTNVILNFIGIYFEYFEFFQKAIDIGNTFEGKQWPKLKQTFALMGAFRSSHTFDPNYSVNAREFTRTNEIRTRDKGENTRSGANDEPVAFAYIKKELAFRFNDFLHQEGVTKARKLTLSLPLVKEINNLLKSYLEICLDVDKIDPLTLNYSFSFIDRQRHAIQYGDLSAGQKAIVHFIFSLYGYGIEKGLFVIDEPELHLHPQMQEKFLEVINKIKDDLDIQFIIVTHSPVFINAKVINNTYRFTLIRGFTKVIHPRITNEEAELVRILTYTNSVKIFFSKKVVLVEGDSDEYFYRKFYDYYKELKNKDPELEFLYISGKGGYELWEKFLRKYYVNTYFIGDWDNVVEFGLISQRQLDTFTSSYRTSIFSNISKSVLMNKGSNDRINMLKSLVAYLRRQTPTGLRNLIKLRDYMIIRYIPSKDLVTFIKRNGAVYIDLVSNIKLLYKKRVFILQEGELEDYLGVSKGLDHIIIFCKNSFETWTQNPSNTAHLDELTEIFDKITA